jgi:hypothetical protein
MSTLVEPCRQTWATLLTESRLDSPETLVRGSPFAFLIAHDLLPDSAIDDLDADFPRYRDAGFFPYDPSECGPSFNALISEFTAPAFANAIGRKLGIPDLGRYPTLVTVSRSLNKSHGKIHTDGKSKVVTALIYLNRDWPNVSGGCLRFLNSPDDINSLIVPEVRPIYGTLVAFRRADNSFHGHLPHEGERRVIQVAWVINEEEKLRKTKQGKASRWLKTVTRFLGTCCGAVREPRA